MNRIVFELCAEDRARLDAIISGLAVLAKTEEPVVAQIDAAFARYQARQAAAPDPAPVPEEVPTQEEAPAPAPAEVKKYSLADVQGRFVKVIAAGKKPEAQRILKDYADAVTAIPADKYAEVMSRLSEL